MSITQRVRQVLLDLLTEYKEMDFPVNPELLKLHIDIATDKIIAEVDRVGSGMEYQAKAGSLAEASPSDSLSRMDGNNE